MGFFDTFTGTGSMTKANISKSELTGMALEAADMLTGLFNAIYKEAEEFSEIRRLAKAGSHLANDYFGLFDSINDDAKAEEANDE